MTNAQKRHRAKLISVLAYIQGNLEGDLGLERLSELAGFSPFHFHRIFCAATGETLAAHVRRLRLTRAAHRLEFGHDSVTRIGLEAGYEAVEAFTRAFKLHFGESPVRYRQTSRQRRRDRVARLLPNPGNYIKSRHGGEPMEVQIVDKPSLRVAYARATGPYRESATKAWQSLCAFAGPAGLFGPQTQFLGVGHDDPSSVAPELLRYDACITVGPHVDGGGDIGVTEIPGGECAVVLHKGPYTGLHEAYMWLYGVWLPQSGRVPAEHPAYEAYLNSPETTAPQDLLTEIRLPLAPR